MSLYTYQCTVHRIIDGDTLELDVDLGFKIHATLTCRLIGINTPETNTPEGKAARNAAAAWVVQTAGAPLVLRTTKAPSGTDKAEKYGRWLAEISLPGVEGTLNQWLLTNGYAVPYDGGAR